MTRSRPEAGIWAPRPSSGPHCRPATMASVCAVAR
ncbi:MAG: hypothetical protein IPI67_32505 [Myxococcales bacterium]|nr:hypothetical protein [Myxococcales bacterium]